MLSLLILSSILWISTIYGQFQTFGPYYYPTGDSSVDTTFLVFGEYNSTHFYMSMTVTGESWFGFGFAQSTGCTVNSGCAGTVSALVGCTDGATVSGDCTMTGTDAMVFGNYGGAVNLAVQEYNLGNHDVGYLHAKQDIGYLDDIGIQYLPSLGVNEYSVYLVRPYNPENYGDRNSYKLPYPLGGDFCWLWAVGDGLTYPPSATHTNQGYQCVDFGGTTDAPTPSPSYGPSPGPTNDPTVKPTKAPTIQGMTEYVKSNMLRYTANQYNTM